MRKTQHDKIIELCADREWHCQLDFRNLKIWSPHKRRGDLEERGYFFEDRPCAHGIRNSKDYRLSGQPTKRVQIVEYLPNGHVVISYKQQTV